MDKYIEENRWYITASKLKDFIKSPEFFYLKYIKEVPALREKEEKHFTIGTAIDDFISYWETIFYQKYFIDEWLKKQDLEERLALLHEPEIYKWLKVDELKELLYWDISKKIKLTAWDGETVLWCVNELQRQKLFKKDGWYTCQKTYIGKYKGLKLKGTLDRDILWENSEIRDTKSCASINSFIWDWKEKLWYDVSMTFYWILKKVATGEKSKLYFDVVQKTFPYPSRIFEIPEWIIEETLDQTIIPALDTLDAVMKAWEETWDESVWKVKQSDLKKLSSCDLYPIMETTIQDDIEILQ